MLRSYALLLLTIAPISGLAAAVALVRSRYERMMKTRTKELATLNSISRALGKTLDLEQTVKIALSHTVVRTGLTGGVVYLMGAGGHLEVAGTCRLPKELSRTGHIRRLWEDLHRQVIESDEIMTYGAAGAEPKVTSNPLGDFSCSALAVIPLRHRGRVVGTLGLVGLTLVSKGSAGRDFLIAVGGQIATAIENARLFAGERSSRRFLEAVEVISEAGLATRDLDGMLGELIRRIVAKMGLNSGSIFIMNDSTQELEAKAAWGFDGDQELRLRAGEGLCGLVFSEKRPVYVMDAENDPRITSPRVKRKKIKSMMGVPLKVGERVIGALHVDSLDVHRFTQEETRLLEAMAQRAALVIENANLYDKLRGSYLSTVMSLTEAVEAKDTHTRGHSEEVAVIAKALAGKLSGSAEFMDELYYAGLLHDVGKIGTPGAILTKPGPLTKEEYEMVKLHPVKGYEIVKPVEGLNGIRRFVLMHHERFDGLGYPHGIGGEEIPFGARIIAVADAFQAMISDRPYRAALTIDKAIEEVKKCKGTQFDPEVVDAFLGLADERYFFKFGLARGLKNNALSVVEGI
ncbi:MAG: HD domain-containing phosphohydrolase [Candidatus Aquicultorales bacterium]